MSLVRMDLSRTYARMNLCRSIYGSSVARFADVRGESAYAQIILSPDSIRP